MSLRQSLLSCLVVGLAFTSVRGDDLEDEEDLEDQKVQGVSINTIFPGSEGQVSPTIKAGELTKALVTFENGAESTFQVEFMQASFADAQNQVKIVQNLTGALVNRTVNQGESVSMVYEFLPSKTILHPIEYTLAISVYFMSEDDNTRESMTAFNQTVHVLDNTSVFDLQSLFLVFLIGGAIYLGIQHFNKKSKKIVKRKTTKAVSASASPEGDDADVYIPREHLRAVQRKGSPTRK